MMNNKDKFIDGFNLYLGRNIAGYQIIKLDSNDSMKEIKRKCVYPIKILFQKIDDNADTVKLISEINMLSPRILYNLKGIPFNCDLGKLKIVTSSDDHISVLCIGKCIKI